MPQKITETVASEWLSDCSDRLEDGWEEPHRSESPWGDVVFEWWCGNKKLAVYFGREEITYVRVWGDDIEEEMDDGTIADQAGVDGLWRWLRT